MTEQIIDNHGRALTYLRMSVTDRCNLRCQYCIPHEKAEFVPREELLSYEEMIRTVRLLATMGINKVRITGGEPLVRKDILYFFKELSEIPGIKWYLTTNGVRGSHYIEKLNALNIGGINLSLDTLQEDKFKAITRRNEFGSTMKTFDAILSNNIPLKINMVVVKGMNDDEIIDMAMLARNKPVDVRFIEEMPFDGINKKKDFLAYDKIEALLKNEIPSLERLNFENTSHLYQVPGWKGKLGIIPAYSRTFCGTCDRIRITATGDLKTCLYGKNQLNLKQLINKGLSDEELKNKMIEAFSRRAKNGFEAERDNEFFYQSMSTIGG